MYEGYEPNTTIGHFVYHNQFDGEYLLPELKHMDFIWWIRGEWIEDEKVKDILYTIRNIKGVQLVAELTIILKAGAGDCDLWWLQIFIQALQLLLDFLQFFHLLLAA